MDWRSTDANADFRMISFIRRAPLALSVCVLTLNFGFAVHAQTSPAQGKVVATQNEVKKSCIEFVQMPLTEKQILGLLDSADEVDEIRENSQDGFYKTGPETTAKLDTVAKRHGLAGYDEYKTIRADVLLVFSGYDRVTKKYVGREPVDKTSRGSHEARPEHVCERKKARRLSPSTLSEFALCLRSNTGATSIWFTDITHVSTRANFKNEAHRGAALASGAPRRSCDQRLCAGSLVCSSLARAEFSR
ncbi:MULTISPECIES: hypothetical protein [unclassified Bradyrhizobium]|uniref:hypothetical protein n=1 Tax=unclassified Bradyrhizobium TaxID=2631580 RepID=UPI0028E280E3|nr:MULTISPECIES: hypothetical protein [unclassified Bradyrhizobium]